MMSDSRAEAELLEQACQGNEAAFLVLYERHRSCIFRFAYRMLGSAALAEDIPARASLRTYLCAAARNLACKHLRRKDLEAERRPDSETGTGPLDHVLSAELAVGVQHAIETLPPLQREAIILFEYEELSLSDIAAAARTDIGTIKSRLHRARQRLRRLLAPWAECRSPEVVEETKS
jgi:RNA polymerase sigma-70 factor (ECF subfamily)